MPKFDVKSSTELNEMLRSLGDDAFDMAEADFTPLTTTARSQQRHAGRPYEDRRGGCEAAAYTEIVCADSAMMEVPPTVEIIPTIAVPVRDLDNSNVPLFRHGEHDGVMGEKTTKISENFVDK